MMKAHLLIGLAVALLVAGCTSVGDGAGDGTGSFDGMATTPGGSGNGDTVTFDLTGENYGFYLDGEENPTLRVDEGDTVRVQFESTEGYHDWRLDAFSAATEAVGVGGVTTVEFVADEKGTFDYYCSVGRHRQLGMAGTFVVE